MELHYDPSMSGKARPQHDRHNSFLSHSYSAFSFPVIYTLSVLSKVIGHLIGYALLCIRTAGESKIWINVFLYNFDNLQWNITFEKYLYWVIFLKDFLNTFSLHPHETSRNLNCDIHCDCPKIWSNYTLLCTDPAVGTVCFLLRVL